MFRRNHWYVDKDKTGNAILEFFMTHSVTLFHKFCETDSDIKTSSFSLTH